MVPELVSGYPTDPNILGPTQTFLKTFGILKSIFRLFLRIYIPFPYKKVFIKKKVCLPTDPKTFGHVTGNGAYFSFGLKGKQTKFSEKNHQIEPSSDRNPNFFFF